MSNFPDRVTHMGGAPIGGNPYLGMWGEKTWFVDYDNGTTGAKGDSPASAQKHLQTIITNASANDVIYIRPRTPNTTGLDPNYIIPASTTNWSIAYAKHGLALIGTGYGSSFYTYLRGTATVTATSAMHVAAPWTLFENLAFHEGASTANCGVHLNGEAAGEGAISGDGGEGYAMGNRLSNCTLRFGSKTSLTIESAAFASVIGCTFHKGAGIAIYSSEQEPDGIEIGWNQFLTETAAEVSSDIYIYGGVDMINIHDNYFSHADPTGGENVYIYVHTASTGIVANNYFGTGTLVTASIMTLNGLVESGSKCAKGFLTS